MLSFLNKKKSIEIQAPVTGALIKIEEVKDPVFSQKMMGDGLAIQYSGGDVYAPVSGEITAVILPSMHAFGIRSEEGAELLVHVGLETVNLKGEGFNFLKQQDEYVKAGEKILEVDFALLKDKGIDLTTPVILTNTNTFEIDSFTNGDNVDSKSTTIFTVKKK